MKAIRFGSRKWQMIVVRGLRSWSSWRLTQIHVTFSTWNQSSGWLMGTSDVETEKKTELKIWNWRRSSTIEILPRINKVSNPQKHLEAVAIRRKLSFDSWELSDRNRWKFAWITAWEQLKRRLRKQDTVPHSRHGMKAYLGGLTKLSRLFSTHFMDVPTGLYCDQNM